MISGDVDYTSTVFQHCILRTGTEYMVGLTIFIHKPINIMTTWRRHHAAHEKIDLKNMKKSGHLRSADFRVELDQCRLHSTPGECSITTGSDWTIQLLMFNSTFHEMWITPQLFHTLSPAYWYVRDGWFSDFHSETIILILSRPWWHCQSKPVWRFS